VAALRSAFMQALADPDLKGEADKAKLELNPVSGDQLQAGMTQILAVPEPVKARLKTILNL
jgi:hypothetical protein